MHFSGNTDPGKQRKENQDAFGCRLLWDRDKVLLIVVDGVGGYAGGEKAAAIARSSIEEYMKTPKGDILAMLREAVIHANNRIVEERNNHPEFFEMCCVLTAVVADLRANQFCFAHVGDTRLYRYRNDVLEKVTRDHSFVGIREDAGELTEAEAMKHPQRNQILREAGSTLHRIDDEDFMDYGIRNFIYGDQLLLCSDGLTDMLTADQISGILKNHHPVSEKVSGLIHLANDMGGFDNITVVMIRHNRKPEKTQVKKPLTALIKDSEKSDAEEKPVDVKKISVSKIILRSILILILIAGSFWYYLFTRNEPEPVVQILPHKEIKVRDSLKDAVLFTTRSSHPAVPGPEAALENDTLKINATQTLSSLQHKADSSKKLLVIMPEKSTSKFPASNITATETDSGAIVIVKNIHFTDFETAIQVAVPVTLQFDNVQFHNISNPVKNTRPKLIRKAQPLLTVSNP